MSKLAKFRLEALNAHNSYRKIHGVPALEYDVELENSAQAYAEELVEADELQVSHGASLGVYGENISRRTSSSKRKPDINGTEVTTLWYRDIEKFDYLKGVGRAGNFTQLVWRDTRQFGIGKAQAPGRVVVVAHYSPAGNVRGQFLENVPPPMTSQEAEAVAQSTRRVSKDFTEDPMLGYRVRSRQVDTKEVREGRSTVLLRRELVEYEDMEGRVKHKVVEDRQSRPIRGSQEVDSDLEPASSDSEDDDGGCVSDERSSRASSRESRDLDQAASAGTASSSMALQMTYDDRVRAEKRLPRNPAELHKFATQVCTAVNQHRKRHEAKPLRLSGELCELAQQLAEELAVRSEKLRPSSVTYRGQRLGQSLAARVSGANSEASAEHVVRLWYGEGKNYNFHEEPTDIEHHGNFTQLVWKASQELGVGKCVGLLPDGSFKLAVVCYFFPAGNVSKEFLGNVHPLKK